MIKRKYAPSKIVCVRYHEEELKVMDKKRKSMRVSDYIRMKSLELDKVR